MHWEPDSGQGVVLISLFILQILITPLHSTELSASISFFTDSYSRRHQHHTDARRQRGRRKRDLSAA